MHGYNSDPHLRWQFQLLSINRKHIFGELWRLVKSMCCICLKWRFWECILNSTWGLCDETILMIVLNLQMDNFTLILFSQNAAHARNLNMVSKEIEYFCPVPDIGTIFLLLSPPGRRGWWQEGDNIKWLRLRENKTKLLGSSSLLLKSAVSRYAARMFFIVLLN